MDKNLLSFFVRKNPFSQLSLQQNAYKIQNLNFADWHVQPKLNSVQNFCSRGSCRWIKTQPDIDVGMLNVQFTISYCVSLSYQQCKDVNCILAINMHSRCCMRHACHRDLHWCTSVLSSATDSISALAVVLRYKLTAGNDKCAAWQTHFRSWTGDYWWLWLRSHCMSWVVS